MSAYLNVIRIAYEKTLAEELINYDTYAIDIDVIVNVCVVTVSMLCVLLAEPIVLVNEHDVTVIEYEFMSVTDLHRDLTFDNIFAMLLIDVVVFNLLLNLARRMLGIIA